MKVLSIFSLKNLFNFLVIVLVFISCQINNNNNKNQEKILKIGLYKFNLPLWWDSIYVSVPHTLKSGDEIQYFVESKYGSDTGTKNNWKYALKTYAIADSYINEFPVYIAHCYVTGKKHKDAIKVYSDLYYLVDSLSEKYEENKEWYKTYLAYHVGIEYEKLLYNCKIDNYKIFKERAKLWFFRAINNYNSDGAIRYYSNESKKHYDMLK